MRNLIIILFSIVIFTSCSNKPSLQKYFVENTESKDFIAMDLGSDIINTEKMSLTDSDKEALKSFEKINVLAFKKDENNKDKYGTEIEKVKTILNDTISYKELMKFGSGNDGASIYFVGDDDHINEFVLFANKKENGFAVVRVLGKDMNPMNIMNIINLMQKADINLEQLKPLQNMK
jgi:hypothetical protein